MNRSQRVRIPGVKQIITICSAKGGVGKSTTTVNTALALKNLGHSVGIVDADVTGPSIPTMMSVEQAEVETYRTQGVDRFTPPTNYGVKVMSMGLMVPFDEAITIRGPMIAKYMRALLFQTDWDDLDYLLIDMPPGTHDVHLTVTQEVQLTGAVIVSTPQRVALADVRRGVDMFAAVNVPVLGVVENMSYFICDNCDKKHAIFGAGGVDELSKDIGLPMLGRIPYVPKILSETDRGAPPALRGDETIPAAKPYYDLARAIIDALAKTPQKNPEIVFE